MPWVQAVASTRSDEPTRYSYSQPHWRVWRRHVFGFIGFTILLVFLLKSWSTDPPVRPNDASFALPSSTSDSPVSSVRSLDLTEHHKTIF